MITNFSQFSQMKVLLNNELIALPIPTPAVELQKGSVIIIRDKEYNGVYEIEYYIYYKFESDLHRFPKVNKIYAHPEMEWFEYVLAP